MKFDIIIQWVLPIPQENRDSPTCPKRSQQGNSEPHVLPSNGWCEAVGIKDAGSVLSSEKCIVVVIRIIPTRCVGGKPTLLSEWKAAVLNAKNAGKFPITIGCASWLE